MEQIKIKPHDIVKHIPSGEEWVVCGVNYANGELIPCGYPFPSFAKIVDCELIESSNKEQSEEYCNALKREGCNSYILAK